MAKFFIAIKPKDSEVQKIMQLVKKLRTSFDQHEIDVKWVPAENFHITLKFLGDLSSDDISKIKDALEKISEQTAVLTLRLGGLGAFDNVRQARVLFLDVQRSQALLDLQTAIETILNLPSEFEFYPHLTLARLRNPKSIESTISPFKKADIGKSKITRLSLFESHIQGHFPVYKELFGFNLQEQSDTE